MQNKSFNDHYYKIKKVPLSQYYSMSEENLSSGFPAIPVINQGIRPMEMALDLIFL